MPKIDLQGLVEGQQSMALFLSIVFGWFRRDISRLIAYGSWYDDATPSRQGGQSASADHLIWEDLLHVVR